MFRRKRKPRQERTSGEIEQYTRGMLRYRRGRHAEAARLLEPLGSRPGPVGQMARYYAGMANRALGLAAMREGDYDRAEGHLRAASRSIGGRADLSAWTLSTRAPIAPLISPRISRSSIRRRKRSHFCACCS